ncbi:MAG: hypothetical protein JST73_12915 [Actinobacteria bacterium]|nr:hypothetical protein [Actinomycetota bacterium]
MSRLDVIDTMPEIRTIDLTGDPTRREDLFGLLDAMAEPEARLSVDQRMSGMRVGRLRELLGIDVGEPE